MFSMVAPAYGKKYGVGEDELTEVLARISWKNHQNGAQNPRAQFRKEVSIETICASPRVAGRLGVFDCAGVADGAAAAIVVRAEDAHRYTDKPLYIKALSFSAGSGSGLIDPDYDYTWFPECARPPRTRTPGRHHRSAAPAGHGRGARLLHAHRAGAHGGPRLRRAGHGVEGGPGRHVRPRRRAARSIPTAVSRASATRSGASGLRMFFETWLQLRGEATPERQIHTDRTLALTHNLGGYPGEMVSFVSVVGTELG